MPPVALIALDPDTSGDGFRANLVVTVDELDPDTTVETFTDTALEVQDRVLDRMWLIDRSPARLRSGFGTRTLVHHDADGFAVVLEQWRLVHGTLGYTVSASCAALDYDDVADVFATAATSLRP